MTPLGADQADLRAVEAIVRAAGTSFHRGMAVLPKDRRHAMYAIYAFCRIVDDIVDEPGDAAEKRAALDEWRRHIALLYAGRAEDAVTRVLLLAVRKYDLRQADFFAVIDGMQTDGETTVVAPDLAALDLYCDRVAAAVGRLSVRAFGDASVAADVVAHHLGRALQLTNILRDIAEDAARGRCYLPREFFAAPPPATAAEALARPELPEVCARVADLAHGHFDDAATAMMQCGREAMRPARLMGATYAEVLRALERRGWQALDQPATLPKWRKIWLALRYGLA
ncbi:MAG: presqualene diphosphate synthase HpnD [Alphaproteobacteria bacterium]|nr:presqualene diphosphate synthase HpnD [Alphaproteobacteria bacterium]